MRISYEEPKTVVDGPEAPSDLFAGFVRIGRGGGVGERVGADLANVVTAQVISKKPHPDSDHMWLCQVSVGDRNVDADGNPVPLQIVCGAQNFEEGDHIVTAMIGAVLPASLASVTTTTASSSFPRTLPSAWTTPTTWACPTLSSTARSRPTARTAYP